MFSVSFCSVSSCSPDVRAGKADSESVRKTAFLGFFGVLTQRMEVYLYA